MNGPITWAAIGALVPLIGAAISFGMLLARVNQLVSDQKDSRSDVKSLRLEVQRALTTLAQHNIQIQTILDHQADREREYLALLRSHFGVGNSRGDPTNDQA